MSGERPPQRHPGGGVEPSGSKRLPVIPPVEAVRAAGTPVRLAWTNEAGGRTFEIADSAGRYFLKWTPVSSGIDLGRDAEHRQLSADHVLSVLERPPAVDRLVVCHGDSCAPNTLLGVDGTWTGHVDLGSLGVADRWADLAIATWSTEWNYGPGWSDRLLAAYGIDADPARMAFYRLLWDLGP